jgi:hypothetical protein
LAKRQRTGEKLDKSAFARDVGQALVARGLGRLSDKDLLAIHELRKKMALASERACPCFWDSSGCSQPDVLDGVSLFNDSDLAAWGRLSAVAGRAELEATAPLPPMQAELEQGLTAVIALVPSDQRARLDAVIEATGSKTPPSKAEQCFAMRTVFAAAEGLPVEQRVKFVRALVSP